MCSALYANYKELQNLLKKEMYILNPNDDVTIKTNLIKIMDTPYKVEQLLQDTIKLINVQFFSPDVQDNILKLSDSSFVKRYHLSLEILLFSF